MKCVAVGDIFITPEMMREAFEKFSQYDCRYFYFGGTDRRQMRDTVKMIEAGRRDDLSLPEGLKEAIADADLLMVHLCPVTKELLFHADKLKYVLCNRGGFENIDIDALNQQKIKLLTNPAHNANAVAEYTIGLILSELRNISRSHLALKNGAWREKYPNSGRIIELKDLTVGIVGFGNVGELVCEKLSGFGCRVLISDLQQPQPTNPNIRWENVSFVSFDELVSRSDIISLHARAPKGTVLFGEKEFDRMKQTSYFINTSRSYMVDYDALYHALQQNSIRGAAIDVFEVEPLGPSHPLLELDNITLTNHRGGDTLNSYADSPFMMLQQMEQLLNGRTPKFWVNKGAVES